MPWLLYPQGKRPWYPLHRRLGGPQSRSRRGDKKNSQSPPGFEPRSSYLPARSQTLYRLSYPGSGKGIVKWRAMGARGQKRTLCRFKSKLKLVITRHPILPMSNRRSSRFEVWLHPIYRTASTPCTVCTVTCAYLAHCLEFVATAIRTTSHLLMHVF
jgi:hypothetical protein